MSLHSSLRVDKAGAAARFNAKNPAMLFEADSQAKRKSAVKDLRVATNQWLDGVYQQLESQRRSGGFP